MTQTRLDPLAGMVWRTRYRGSLADGTLERSPRDTAARVARALAATERDPAGWERRFAAIMADFRFLPGGRILAGAGAASSGMLLNCFVMGPLEDAPERLFAALGEGAITLQQGGGAGWDFSTLRPRGWRSGGVMSAPGPVACLDLWDAACRVMTTGSARGGAMMGALSIAHPDIAGFIGAKARVGALPRFNLSVQVTDAFLTAVAADAPWALSFGDREAGRVRARDLWDQILQTMLQWSEPGILFVDTINRENNLGWREHLGTTNPCGEAPLPAYGACDLGSINLAALVRAPFSDSARIEPGELAGIAGVAVRLLDNVLDVTAYPLARQRRQAMETRRVGLGITGLADALAMMGLRYDGEPARTAAQGWLECIKLAAYEASTDIAAEKGAYPAFNRDRCLAAPFVARLPGGLRDRIATGGLRNSHLLAIAPTGSVSLLAGNVSQGVEPIVALDQRRQVRGKDGTVTEFAIEDRAWAAFRARPGSSGRGAFLEAAEVSPEAQIDMQATLQRHVDGAISKTVLLPEGIPASRLGALAIHAHRTGLKGFAAHCLTSRRGSVVGPGCAGRRAGPIGCDPG